MVETRDTRTVFDKSGTPILEIMKEGDAVTIYEADDLDRQITFPVGLIPTLLNCLGDLK